MLDIRQSLIGSTLHKVLKRLHYPLEVTVHRWAIKVLPVLAAVFRQRKRPVGKSWQMDETCIKVSGQWTYPYRAINRHDAPGKITIDKSGANTAAINGAPTALTKLAISLAHTGIRK